MARSQPTSRSGGSARYDDQGYRYSDGRRQILGYSRKWQGGREESEQRAQDRIAASRARVDESMRESFGGLKEQDAKRGRSLRDEWQFPGLDAQQAMQRRRGGGMRQPAQPTPMADRMIQTAMEPPPQAPEQVYISPMRDPVPAFQQGGPSPLSGLLSRLRRFPGAAGSGVRRL